MSLALAVPHSAKVPLRLPVQGVEHLGLLFFNRNVQVEAHHPLVYKQVLINNNTILLAVYLIRLMMKSTFQVLPQEHADKNKAPSQPAARCRK